MKHDINKLGDVAVAFDELLQLREENEMMKESLREGILGGEYRSCGYGNCPFCGSVLDYDGKSEFKRVNHEADCGAVLVLE